ncbi:MAB_1171c family putative transporter [Streptomyces sp. PR69]|uniref:MAB_1171c family putative transporter n=1 Tax=Streptomyces sp. PR69 TaxID=2984950 RepID=UPI0022644F39|nr:MAB_1171c family putative transporter [Streptomyces sp. PR69]
MDGPDYYIPAAALGLALAFKLPGMRRNWRDPLLRSVCALLALAASTFFFAAPPTITAVNRLVGVPNFSAPLVYSILTALGASCLVLLVNWRGGPPEQTRTVARRWMYGYGAVVVALNVLFFLGDAPVERLRDLDTHYAGTPYIREMIVLYLAAHSVAAAAMTAMCWRWSRKVRGWLRTGLVTIVVGSLFSLGYGFCKSAAVLARWAGADLDALSTSVAPPLASLGALLSAAGFVLPLLARRVGDHWSAWYAYRLLGPLWRELRAVVPASTPSVRIPRWAPADLRVTQRESDIHDGLLFLHPYFDRALRAEAHRAALGSGVCPEQARAVADAAMISAALRARAADPEGRVIASAAGAPSAESGPAASFEAGEGPHDLVRISLALRRSPVVAQSRRTTAPAGA